MKPLISVVTVVLNREKVVERCVRSILSQSFTNFEYIVKDGKSTDGTLEILDKYKDKFSHFESTADKNLYDAMNIATQHATGEWVCYIQSDDMLFSPTVFEEVAPYLEKTSADIVYGTALMEFDWNITKTLEAKPVETMWRHMPFCHQAAFVRTTVMKEHLFDLTYKTAADYDLVYKLYSQGFKFESIPIMVAKLSAGGASDTKRLAGLREVGTIKKKYDQNKWHHFMHSLYTMKSAINLWVRNILPQSVVKSIFKIRSTITEK